MGAKIFLSHTFHVRNKYLRIHPKPSPAFRMVRLRVILIVFYVFFTLSIFIILLTLSLYRQDGERSFVPALLLSGDHGAPPPPVRNQETQDECWGDRGKKDIGE